MSFLPIVARELRVSARKPGTFWLRVSAALGAITLGSWWFLIRKDGTRAELAVPMFGLMTGSATLYCLLSGVWHTADCLSREKREGTLGLLFLTDLRGYDVVLGKLAATSLGAVYGVLAVVPMLGVPLLIGGVTVGEFGRMALVILNSLFFSLTLGLAVSAVSRSGRKATMIAFLLVLTVAFLPPIVAAILEALGKWPRAQAVLILPSPLFTFATAFDAMFRTMSRGFWWSLGTVHSMSWFCLAIASIGARRSWQDRPEGDLGLRWYRAWRHWGRGSAEERLAWRRELLDRNAFYWLAARGRHRPTFVWVALGLLALAWLGLLLRVGREDWLSSPVYLITALVLNLVIKVWVAAESSRQMAEDRQEGTIELVLSTALSVPEILRGQWLALTRQFLAPVLVILGVLFAFQLGTVRDPEAGNDRPFVICFYSTGMVMLVVDLIALYWLGMWRGLTAKTPQRAFLGGVLRILVLPWIGMAGALLVFALAPPNHLYESRNYTWFGLWVLFGLSADLGFAGWARYKLQSDFRLAASGRFSASTPPSTSKPEPSS